MKSTEKKAQQLLRDIRNLKHRFFEATRYFDDDDYADALKEASDVNDHLLKLTSELNESYLSALLEIKLSTIQGDRDQLKSLDETAWSSSSVSHLLGTLVRIRKNISTLEKETKTVFDVVPRYIRWLRNYGKNTLMVLFGVALLGFGIKLFMDRQGLRGEYYRGINFNERVKTRTDHRIDFDWGFNGPHGLKDEFSVRWTGSLVIPKSGTYEFATRTDDGVRLSIDNQMIIDHWATHPAKTDAATLALSKGLHSIRLEYFEYKRQAVMQLLWKKEGKGLVIIPSSNLRTSHPSS